MLNNTYLWVLLLLVALLTACRSIENYAEADGPLYTGSYAETSPAFSGEIKIITWNIKFSKEIDAAIAELQEVEELRDADILLLQEMDEVGVERIAKSLKYNYIYFPASIHTHHNKNFGNAILSRWPLSEAEKVILPHPNPKNQQTRIAVRGRVKVGGQNVLVYSVHTETAWLSQTKRADQIDTLLADIGPDERYVIVGGDFNTVTQENVQNLEKQFEQAALKHLSKNAGHTFEPGGVELQFDHIFARGVTTIESGVTPAAQASDHFPLWVKMEF
jgi:endonuclease/exonuclease/phosphatase family metal-dependent hydrolase